MYEAQIQIKVGDKLEYQSISPTKAPPYKFKTESEAWDFIRKWYKHTSPETKFRVIESK
jgi:hypothetical protein